MSRHRQNEKPTEHSTAQDVINLIYKSENDGQPPPDNLTVAGIINWMPEIEINHQRWSSLCDEATTENNDWPFADKVYFRLKQCAKVANWKTEYSTEEELTSLDGTHSTNPDNHCQWHILTKQILPKLLNPSLPNPQLIRRLNFLERMREITNKVDLDIDDFAIDDFAQSGDKLIETTKAFVLAARESNLDIKHPILAAAIAEMTQEIEAITTIGKEAYGHDKDFKSAILEIPIVEATLAITAINILWVKAHEHNNDLMHPITPIVTAFIKEQDKRKGTCSIGEATIDQANDFTPISYPSSEVTRRQWENIGNIDTVEVDGEPIANFIADVDNFSVGYPQVYKPKGTGDQLQLALPKGRETMEVPITLIAYQMFGSDLRSSLATDVALLMQIAYATNEKLILNVKAGAALLSRDREGNPRHPHPTDEKRFEKAFACLHGMSVWITDDRDIPRFYPLTACDRLSNDEVIISAPAWARREKGRWTLTATLGETGRLRFKGNAHNNNIKRVIDGIEYWLARDRRGYGGTSQSLLPAHKNTGPGPWQTLKWDKLLMLAGDIWDTADNQANQRAYKRFHKIRTTLIEYGYQVPDLNHSARAGDSVEFLFDGKKDGKLKVRASKRFVEAARKAQRGEFSSIPLNKFLRLQK